MMNVRPFLIGIAVCLILVAGQARAELVGADFFGMHVHKLPNDLSSKKFPYGFLRLWDTGTSWAHLERSQGNWDFKLLDGYVTAAEKSGSRILYVLGMTPAWAAKNPSAESHYMKGASSPPADVAAWRTYVRTLATRYKGRIQHWELWNEVNVKKFYSGDVKTLIALEQAAAEELKAVDAGNILLSASFQGGAFTEFDKYLAAGGARAADGIAYHFYALKEEPEELRNRINKVRDLMHKHGLGSMPLWNTEFGWLLANRDGTYGSGINMSWLTWRKVGYDEAPGIVMRAMLVSMDGRVKSSFWYAWDNSAMGLSENGQLKPAAYGFTRLQEWVVGAEFGGCQPVADIWRCRLSRNGSDSWIVWSQRQQSFAIPPTWRVSKLQRYAAQPVPLTSTSIEVGPVPILLIP